MSVKAKNIDDHYKSPTGAKHVAKPYTDAQLKGVFRLCSADGDGRLSRQELKNAFSRLGSFAPGWRAIRALRQVDKNRDSFTGEKELDNLVRYAAKQGYTVK